MASRKKATVIAPVQHAFSLMEEFKAFAFKGHVIDLAVGVMIGAAFGRIVESLVKHIFMPLIGTIMPGEEGYLGWKWIINGKEVPYGLFLGEVVNFSIVAVVLFIFIVKFLGWVMTARKQEVVKPLPPTKEEELLMEIRDLLKARAAN